MRCVSACLLGCIAVSVTSGCTSTTGRTAGRDGGSKQVTSAGVLHSSPAAVHVGATASATALCHAANIGQVISVSATTVHAIRSIKGGHSLGPPQRLIPGALRPAVAKARAAWCWTTAEGTTATASYGTYHAYVVTNGVPPQLVGRMKSPRSMASGEYPIR